MNEQYAEKDRTAEVERLRKEHNAAVANGLLMRARQIGHHMDALLRKPAAERPATADAAEDAWDDPWCRGCNPAGRSAYPPCAKHADDDAHLPAIPPEKGGAA